MGEYVYKATGIIAKAFEKHRICYDYKMVSDLEELSVCITLKDGNCFHIKIISSDNQNHVVVRVYDMFKGLSTSDTKLAIQTCNMANDLMRYFKFFLYKETIVGSYDFPISINEECIGEVAVGVIKYFIKIVEENYSTLVKILNKIGGSENV